jgi:hypothetical protein
MARRQGEGALGGDRAGEGWAREKELTSGARRSVSGVCARERESGEALTGGARRSVGRSGARVGPPGPEERGVAGARELGWNSAQPREGRGFFLFLFLF